MFRLYFVPGVCSIAPQIALREAGLPFELDRVELQNNKRTSGGASYVALNPKGYVPALRLPDGQLLTENVAILQYIADLKPESGLAPPPGSFERVRLQEWLNFIATELHKGMSPLYSPLINPEYQQAVRDRFAARLKVVEEALAERPFLFGSGFSLADCYGFYVLRAWQKRWNGTVPEHTAAYFQRLSARPSIMASLAAEGLA